MLPNESGVPKNFNSYLRSIPGNLYLFKCQSAPLGNISSYISKRIDETKAVVGKFKLHTSITMHIFTLKFQQLKTETVSHVTIQLESNKLTCCNVSLFPLEKCFINFDKIKIEKFSVSAK